MNWWGSNNPYGGGTSFAYRQKFGYNDLVLGGAFDGTTGYLDSSDSHQVRGTLKFRHRFKNAPGLNIGINLSGAYSWGKTFFFWNGLDSNGLQDPFPNTITIYKDQRFTVDPFIDYYDKNNNHFRIQGRFLNATNTNSTGQGSIPDKYYAEVQYQRKLEFKALDFNFNVGLVNDYDHVNPPAGSTSSLFGKNTENNFSAYTQLDFKFFKRLSVSLGARWEYFKMWHYVQDTSASGQIGQRLDTIQNSLKQLPYPLFRAGINYQAAQATFIRASFGQGFRYPTIAERYISTNVGAITIASNPYLQPEKGESAEIGIKQGFKLGKGWSGYFDAAGFINQYDNMMEFSFGQYGNHDWWYASGIHGFEAIEHSFGTGFSSQNIGKARIMGTEIMMAGEGTIGKVKVEMMVGYTYIDPRSLNWNDSLSLYNYQGYKLGNGYEIGDIQMRAAYRNPDSVKYLTYAQTSSSTQNFLKYRSRHNLKVDITLTWKGIEWNSNLQFNSYLLNIDYAFVSPLITGQYPGAFGGLAQYRQEKEATPIGKGRGDIVWNMRLAYNFKAGVKIAFIVNNLLNWEYTPRPAYYGDPRNYQVQLVYTFKGKKKNEENSSN